MRGREPPASRAGQCLLARRDEIRPGQDGALVHRLPNIVLGPPGRPEQSRVLRAQHHQSAQRLLDQRAGAGDRAGDVGGQLLGHRGVPGVDVQAGADGQRGHRAVRRGKPNSACNGGHGLCSSFSAMQAVYLAGVPWVA